MRVCFWESESETVLSSLHVSCENKRESENLGLRKGQWGAGRETNVTCTAECGIWMPLGTVHCTPRPPLHRASNVHQATTIYGPLTKREVTKCRKTYSSELQIRTLQLALFKRQESNMYGMHTHWNKKYTINHGCNTRTKVTTWNRPTYVPKEGHL